MDEENELLEYETEQEDQPFEIAPIPVKACEPIVTVPTVPQHVSCGTIVVATGTDGGVEVLLPQDALRVRATIIANDQPVVIGHSRAQAGSASNQTANVPNPSGAYLPTGLPLVINSTQQMFVAATSSTPARVTVIVERRSA